MNNNQADKNCLMQVNSFLSSLRQCTSYDETMKIAQEFINYIIDEKNLNQLWEQCDQCLYHEKQVTDKTSQNISEEIQKHKKIHLSTTIIEGLTSIPNLCANQLKKETPKQLQAK